MAQSTTADSAARNTQQAAGLAIVIPAFKSRHLAATLAAFAAQSDQRFRLYVADDCSPEDLKPIVAPFSNQLNLVYHRFDQNLGSSSLIGHWDRAIALSDEPWIWLFSDDDSVSPDCVAAFWSARARSKRDMCLHRYQCECIDADGNPIPGIRPTAYPPEQTWEQHLHATTHPKWGHLVVIQNVVFPRRLYEAEGGFSNYPLGMWSDIVTWARWARRDGILTMNQGLVYYRLHGGSIGGPLISGSGNRCHFIRTASRMIEDLRQLYQSAGTSMPIIRYLNWIARTFRYSNQPLNRSERKELSGMLKTAWPAGWGLRQIVFWWHACRPLIRQYRSKFSISRFVSPNR